MNEEKTIRDEIIERQNATELVSPIFFKNTEEEDGMYGCAVTPQLPFSLPINLMQCANEAFMAADNEFITQYMALGQSIKRNLADTDMGMQVYAIVEYIRRNTFANFSNMIDLLPDYLTDALKLTRIKEIAFDNIVFDSKNREIRRFNRYSCPTDTIAAMQSVIYNSVDSIYSCTKSYKSMDDFELGINNTAVLDTLSTQITNALYAIMAYTIDTAISEAFNNVYNIPNFDEIMKHIHSKFEKAGVAHKDPNLDTVGKSFILCNAIKSIIMDELTKIMPTVQISVYNVLNHPSNIFAAFKDKLATKAMLDYKEEMRKKYPEDYKDEVDF